MGLITKTVIMKWSNRNKKYYKEKGYNYNESEEFEVKIEDLPNSSHSYIEIQCDRCSNIKKLKWDNYSKYVKEDGKYYCHKCALVLYGSENRRLAMLSNSISFQKWCEQNNRQNVLDRWDYELNKLKPNEISYSSDKICWFKCDKHTNHKSEQKRIKDFTKGHEGSIVCNQCSSFAQLGIENYGEDFLEKYWSDKNTISPWEIPSQWNKKVWIKCNEIKYHEDYEASPNSFASGNRCPCCTTRNGKLHPLDSLGQLLEDRNLIHIWSDKNIKSAYLYTPCNSQKAWFKCECGKHEDYYGKISDQNKCEFRCPECVRERDESFLQEKVRLYLNELGYDLLHENKCTIVPKNPKTKGKSNSLPFDNEIIELKLLCEVHGIQHYKITNFYIMSAKKNNTTPEYELHKRKLYDRYKKFIAYKQKYDYLEIPYYTEKDDQYKTLIDNKIKEILSKRLNEEI